MSEITVGMYQFCTFDFVKSMLYLVIGFSQQDAALLGSLYGLFIPFGICLAVFYFMLEHVNNAVFGHQEYNLEMYTKEFIKLAITIAFIANVDIFVSMGGRLGNYVLSIALAKQSAVSPAALSSLAEGKGFFNLLFLAIIFAIGGITNIGLQIALLQQFISWKIDFYIRACWMPVSMADIYSGGQRSNGMRYLKHFIGCCITGGGYILMIVICDSLMQSLVGATTPAGSTIQEILQSAMQTLIPIFAIKSAEVGACSLVGNITKEAMD